MATTTRGHIEELPSGAFRVHVYAGHCGRLGSGSRWQVSTWPSRRSSVEPGKLTHNTTGLYRRGQRIVARRFKLSGTAESAMT